MNKISKKILVISLCVCTMLNTSITAFAKEVTSNDKIKMKSKIFLNSDVTSKGAKNIFKIENDKSLDVGVELKEKKFKADTLDSGSDIDYNMKIKDIDDDYVDVKLKGTFFVDGLECTFSAQDDKVEKIFIDDNLTLLMGVLDGKIIIDKKERDVLISFEKANNNLYLAFSINCIDSEEGMGFMVFGDSILTEELISKIEQARVDDSEDMVKTQSSYYYVDSEWQEIVDNQTFNRPLYGRLYIQSTLADGYSSGRIRTRVSYDSNDLKEEFENDFPIYDIYCNGLYVDYYNLDGESAFSTHHPDEDDSKPEIGDFVAAALYDLGIPSFGLSLALLADKIAGTTSGVTIYNDNDSEERHFYVNFSGNTDYMDWYLDHDNGYCVDVLATNAVNSVDDDIQVKTDMYLKIYFYSNGYLWGNVRTQKAVLDVDLADYK